MRKPSTKKSGSEQISTDKEMSEYGISRVPMDDQYQYGNYRYTSLKHAVAQAKRERDQGKQ